ncbi:MAG: hypothetical protein COS35_13690 [Zetaproteobacteria bacterium CG02_land_8_20_14_3_00_50_9]|nr:MAG: hypothetical protein COW62_12970 [Zetaproteobacteria bacterium CG17_big_fil_post_rev_8_21_14_2_50_50_13]PIV29133.1 MAG: hypothetical protein COS35_13690 [Zetaproteobacteria bacterium CG02_land_8_20_14_3_00_50_9]
MKKMISQLFALTLLFITTPAMANIASEGGHHVNFMSFMPIDNMHGKFEYPAEVKGTFADVMKSFEGKAEPFAIVHPPRMHSGDILNVQVDALGEEGDNAALEDDGIDCQFSLKVVGKEFLVGGVCNISVATHKGNVKNREIIEVQSLPATDADSNALWKLLYVNEASGVAMYGNVQK